MTAEDDPNPGKVPRLGRPWAREKLALLRYYLGGTGEKGGGFMVATRNAPARYLLDLFAGPGQSRLEDGELLDGSPLIAAKATPSFTRLFWVEARGENARSLEAHRADYPDRNITILQRDANAAVGDVLSMVPRNAATLAFLDPEGAELQWSTIARLARHKQRNKIELFILFAYDMGIVRLFPRNPAGLKFQATLDRFMPDPDGWRRVYEQRATLSVSGFRLAILNEYTSGLRKLGYQHVPPPRLIGKPDGRSLYFMIFASDVEAGLNIMKYAFERVESTARQPSFLPYDQQY